MIEKNQIEAAVAAAAHKVRETNPMAGSITNTVTIDFVANAQLAVGGSAAMVYLPDEGEALVAAGNAVYLNMGTLFPIYEQTIPATAKAAHDAGKAWVLDPVGLGIGSLRTKLLEELKPYKPTVIRGTASEISALASLWELLGAEDALDRPRGVDTTDGVDAAREAAVALAHYTGGAVVVSGEVDLVTDGTTVVRSHGGSELMSKITGCGCSQGGVLAVYATCADAFTAAVAGTAHYNLAGTRAAAVATAPASFKVAFIDELYRATGEEIAANPMCVIRESDLPSRTTSMFTEIEGEWDEVMQVVKDATFVLAEKGIRTEVVLKADVRPGFDHMMDGKLERLDAQLKAQEA